MDAARVSPSWRKLRSPIFEAGANATIDVRRRVLVGASADSRSGASSPADPALRARHQARVAEAGRSGLHADLARVDPESARQLAPNDFVRVSRALEVFELTGVRMSDWQAAHGFKTARHAARLLGVQREKSELDQRILARCRAMLQAGWVAEATRLLQAGYAGTRPFTSVGYKQIALALETGQPIDMDWLELSIFRATRVFARRQRTWLRDQPIEWLPPGSTKL